MQINGRNIGDGNPSYIIAEMSANHAGSIQHAKEIIHAAKETGADCLKIQTYTADTITMNCHNKFLKYPPQKSSCRSCRSSLCTAQR